MILSNPFSQKEFTDFIKDFLPDFVLNSRKVEVGSSGFMEVLRLGESSSLMTSVLIVRSAKKINSRISLTNNSFKILKNSISDIIKHTLSAPSYAPAWSSVFRSFVVFGGLQPTR